MTDRFDAVSEINRRRCERWHPGFPDDEWTGGDWGNALAGEVGELCNIVKKLRRHESGHSTSYNTPPPDELLDRLAEEAADVWLYLDLLLSRYGVSRDQFYAALVDKFDLVSRAQGWDDLTISPNGPTT